MILKILSLSYLTCFSLTYIKYLSLCFSMFYPMPSHNTGMPRFSNFTLSVCLYFTPCQAITMPRFSNFTLSVCLYFTPWHWHANNANIFKFHSLCVSVFYPIPSHNTAMPTMPRFSNFTLPVCLCITPCQAITLACQQCQHFQISLSLCVYILPHAKP